MHKLSISEVAYLLGVSTDTLRRWEEEKKLTPERTEGGHRRYDLTTILKDKATEGLTVLYCRVSTRPQKKDLDRQIAVLETYAEINNWQNCLTLKDIGSGVNYKKKGLNKLLALLVEGKVSRLVLTNKDRLPRFCNALFTPVDVNKHVWSYWARISKLVKGCRRHSYFGMRVKVGVKSDSQNLEMERKLPNKSNDTPKILSESLCLGSRLHKFTQLCLDFK